MTELDALKQEAETLQLSIKVSLSRSNPNLKENLKKKTDCYSNSDQMKLTPFVCITTGDSLAVAIDSWRLVCAIARTLTLAGKADLASIQQTYSISKCNRDYSYDDRSFTFQIFFQLAKRFVKEWGAQIAVIKWTNWMANGLWDFEI